jgi:hypothetical protein
MQNIELAWISQRILEVLQPIGRCRDHGDDRLGRVSRQRRVSTAAPTCTRDEGRSFKADSQVQTSNHCKLLSSKTMVVSVAVNVGIER